MPKPDPYALLETIYLSRSTCNMQCDEQALIKDIEEMIDKGEHEINHVDQYGITLLSDAAERGLGDVCMMLLKKEGVDIHVKDNDFKRTALHWAAASGSYATVEKLIEMGADINLIGSKGFTPLTMACSNAHKKHLLDYKVTDTKTGKEIKDHPAKKSVKEAYDAFEKIVKLLLDKGAEVDPIVQDTEQNPIFYAAEHSDLDILKLLIKAGANVNHKDKWGLTPLHFACRNGGNVQGEQTLKILIKAGANIDEQDDCGFTPLMEAVMGNHVKAVKLMLKEGADKSLKLTKGYTPYTNNETALDIAKDKKFKELEKLLK